MFTCLLIEVCVTYSTNNIVLKVKYFYIFFFNFRFKCINFFFNYSFPSCFPLIVLNENTCISLNLFVKIKKKYLLVNP